MLLAPWLCVVLSAAPFPLPSVDGKAVAASAGQRTFHLPVGFGRLEKFYRAQFGSADRVTLRAQLQDGRRTLVLKSTRPTDAWAKAVVKEGELDTVVEVTPVLRAGEERVEGNGRPLVEFVLTRSKEFDRMVEGIDHSSDAHR